MQLNNSANQPILNGRHPIPGEPCDTPSAEPRISVVQGLGRSPALQDLQLSVSALVRCKAHLRATLVIRAG